MAIIIDGLKLSNQRKEALKEEVIKYQKKYPRLPHLAVILVGNDVGSQSYVRGKEKACMEVGILNTTIRLDEKVNEEELLNEVNKLNNDTNVDGILVQLPLPKHINQDLIISSILHHKDVDGFHYYNVARLYQKQQTIYPCTPKGIITMLKSQNIEISGKNACVIGRSNIVGLPVGKMLLDLDATVITVHSKTKNIKDITSQADILIVAIGKAKFVTKDFIKKDAVVIDVGVNRDLETNKLCGDVDFDDCVEKASFITKVPGGVGPMTICTLLENTIEVYLKHMEK